jgi:guanylate kinase
LPYSRGQDDGLQAMKKKGKLFIISAPSGSGKTTLCEKLVGSLNDLTRSISMTTRSPRQGERDGVDYIFIGRKEFLKRKEKGEFLEWAKVFGEYYGTPQKYIARIVNKGHDVILNIDVRGAMKIKKLKLKSAFIFVLPPSLAQLKERLKARSTDSSGEIRKRLDIAKKEMEFINKYDYVVVNKVLDAALENLRSIIIAERCKTERS